MLAKTCDVCGENCICSCGKHIFGFSLTFKNVQSRKWLNDSLVNLSNKIYDIRNIRTVTFDTKLLRKSDNTRLKLSSASITNTSNYEHFFLSENLFYLSIELPHRLKTVSPPRFFIFSTKSYDSRKHRSKTWQHWVDMFFFWRTPLLFASGIIFLSEKVRFFIEIFYKKQNKTTHRYHK